MPPQQSISRCVNSTGPVERLIGPSKDKMSKTGFARDIVVILGLLAMAFLLWLMFFKDVHHYRRELSMEDRKNAYVGQKEPIREPVKITIRNKPYECMKIESADLDGGEALVYLRWMCPSSGKVFSEFRYKGISADKTILKAEYVWIMAGQGINQNDRLEKHFRIETDPRISEYQLSTDTRTY